MSLLLHIIVTYIKEHYTARPETLGRAINCPHYLWKNLFARAIYCPRLIYSLKGLLCSSLVRLLNLLEKILMSNFLSSSLSRLYQTTKICFNNSILFPWVEWTLRSKCLIWKWLFIVSKVSYKLLFSPTLF